MSQKKSAPSKSQRSTGDLRSQAAAEQLTQQNVETILQLEDAANAQRTSADRVAERIAAFCGSMRFVWVHVIWFGGWVLLNVIPGIRHIDPFPFTFLTLVVSLEAIFLSTFILISQNHDTRISERRSHLDLQLNLLSEQENTKMIRILRQIATAVGADVEIDPSVKPLEQEIDPEKLVQQLENAEAKRTSE